MNGTVAIYILSNRGWVQGIPIVGKAMTVILSDKEVSQQHWASLYIMIHVHYGTCKSPETYSTVGNLN